MAKSKCCFGCTNSRNCAWVISIFNMFVCVLLLLPILRNLSYISLTHSSIQRPQDLISKNFLTFNLLCMLFLLFYTNLNLNKATYTRNVQSIHHWLVTVWIFFIFFILYICFTAFVNRFPHLISIGIPVTTVVAYQIHVVNSYHVEEREIIAAALGGPSLQSVVASSATAAALFPVQAGGYGGGLPYVIHQQRPSSVVYPAALPVYQYPPQQQQQQQHQQQQQQQQFPRSHGIQVVQSDRHEPTPPPPPPQPSSPPPPPYLPDNGGPSVKH